MQQKMHLNIIKDKIELNLDEEVKNIRNKEQQYTVPLFIPHRGCKNECVFCNQRKISGKTKSMLPSDIEKEIIEHLTYYTNANKKVQIAFFGGSFTGLPKKEQIAYLEVAEKFVKNGQVDSIRLSTRPDYINPKILQLLKGYSVKTIELGVQSTDNEVLQSAKRGHQKKHFMRASRLINLYGFELGHQLMIGLPNSTIEKEIQSMQDCLIYHPINLRIYPVYVIEPSELYDMYKEGLYIPLTLQEAIDRTYLVIKECRRSNVKIIRIGLQSTDEITQNSNHLVGPVCDNFAEYVFAKMALEKLENLICEKIEKKEWDIQSSMIYLEVVTKEKNVSFISGVKKRNKQYIEEKYPIRMIVRGI